MLTLAADAIISEAEYRRRFDPEFGVAQKELQHRNKLAQCTSWKNVARVIFGRKEAQKEVSVDYFF